MWDLIVSVPDHCLSFYIVMAGASCNLFCGISFISVGVIQRQNGLAFMTHVENLILI